MGRQALARAPQDVILVDSNVYVALFAEDHPLHPRALGEYREAKKEGTAHNVIILSEVHSVLSRSRGRGEAGRAVRAILAGDETVPMGPGVVERALDLAEKPGLSTNDALIAAHALEAGMELLTFDADFRRVPELRLFRFFGAKPRKTSS